MVPASEEKRRDKRARVGRKGEEEEGGMLPSMYRRGVEVDRDGVTARSCVQSLLHMVGLFFKSRIEGVWSQVRPTLFFALLEITTTLSPFQLN